jgi:hypothetical protein
MQITRRPKGTSYRAVIARGEFDSSQPDLNCETIGLKAESFDDAVRKAHHVTGCHVVECYRQDRGAQ